MRDDRSKNISILFLKAIKQQDGRKNTESVGLVETQLFSFTPDHEETTDYFLCFLGPSYPLPDTVCTYTDHGYRLTR